MDVFYTTEELAEVLRTTPATLRYWRAVGRAPRATKVGRRVLYAERDVEAWLGELNPNRSAASA